MRKCFPASGSCRFLHLVRFRELTSLPLAGGRDVGPVEAPRVPSERPDDRGGVGHVRDANHDRHDRAPGDVTALAGDLLQVQRGNQLGRAMGAPNRPVSWQSVHDTHVLSRSLRTRPPEDRDYLTSEWPSVIGKLFATRSAGIGTPRRVFWPSTSTPRSTRHGRRVTATSTSFRCASRSSFNLRPLCRGRRQNTRIAGGSTDRSRAKGRAGDARWTTRER